MIVREAQIVYRASGVTVDGRRRLTSPDLVVELLGQLVIDQAREHFGAIYLDSRHRLECYQIVSVGTLDQSIVHPREVFRPAVMLGAAAIIVAHNHPSGDPEPSAEDRSVTERLASAGELLGIPLLDHIVWTHGGAHVSFARRGWIKAK